MHFAGRGGAVAVWELTGRGGGSGGVGTNGTGRWRGGILIYRRGGGGGGTEF